MTRAVRPAGLYATVDGGEFLVTRDQDGHYVLSTPDPAWRDRGFEDRRGTGVAFTRPLDTSEPLEVFGLSYTGRYRGEQVKAQPNLRDEFQVWTTDAAAGGRLGFPDVDRGTWLGIVPADDPDLSIQEVREPSQAPWLPRRRPA